MNKKATASRLPSKIAKPISSRQSSRANSPTPSESGALTEYTDDFIVGDRVWVGGTKPGYIQFIGETKFAPGEWAGVVLDEAVGKNDGTVGGVRYFMCEPKRGVFSRLSKLTRDSVGSSIRTSPKPSITSDNEEIQSRRVSSPTNGSVSTSSTRRAVSPTDGVTRLTKQTKRVSASPNTGGQVLTTTTTTTVKHDAVPAASGHVKIGDRVLVGGTKAGVLRYVGTTDFAPGNWCGVELDEPLGKNDGTVAGKKYFDCKMKYGLFAPTHKVTKQPGSSTVTRVVRTTRVAANSPTSSLHKRSGSRESLASMSTTSQRSTPGSRVRLGVTSLTSPSQKSGRPQAANVSATNTALQETLREKEQHIDQLLKERDMDRSEVARAAAQVDAVESQLAALQSDFELLGRDSSAKFEELNYALEQGDKFKNELLAQLEDEKRKVEDLEFQLEEEVLSKGDDDISSISADKEKLLELENALEKEKKKNIQLEQSNQQNSIPQNDTSDLLHLKTSLEQEKLKSSELDDMCKNLKSQIANLSSKDEEIRHLRADGDLMKMHLDEARNKIIHLEMNAKSSNRHSPSKLTEIEKEVATKDGMILQLEASLEQKRKEIVDLQQRISEMDRELDTTKKRNQRQQEIIDNLNVRLASNESSSSNLSDELQELKMHATDLQRKLNASQEKCDNLQHNKVKMEEQLSELMHASGDHSKQFSQLNDMIKMKNNEIEELQSKLQQVTSDLSESNSCSDEMKEKFKIEMSLLEDKLKKEKQVLHEKIKTLDEQLSNTNKKLDDNSLNEDELLKKNAALEMTHLNLKKKEAEVMQLNVKLQESELKADSSSDQLKRVKNELSAIKNDLDGYKNNAESDKESLSSKLMLAETEKERAMLQKDEVEMKLCEMKDRCSDLEKKAALLLKERDEHKHIVDDKEMKLKVLESEVQRLNLEFNSHKAELMEKLKEQQLESGAVSGLSEQLQEYHKQMQELQEDFITCEKQNHDLRADVERLCDIENEKISFQEECERLKAEIKSVTEQENKNLLDLESVKRSLNQQLESSQVQSEQRQKDLEVMQTQINIMQAEKQALCNNNGSKNFEEEKKKLENKVNELQSMVTTYQNEGKSGNFDLAKFQEEKESSEAQIEFLNSVIVDMQKKNDDLTSKVQILETGVSLETNDINLNGIKTAVVAPRLFCDICDRFDLHDTEDCPKQAMSEESPPASQHHADRNQRRPYCEICEMFGHETNECDDVETF